MIASVINVLAKRINQCVVGNEGAGAITSDDDAYRYVLWRTWNEKLPVWVYCMINPSTARVDDDQTIRKCKGFARFHGAGTILVVNTMAYSTPHPKHLVRMHNDGFDVFGPCNNAALEWATQTVIATRRIAAWGKIPKSVAVLTETSRGRFIQCSPHCFGVNSDGTPKHPLTLPYSTPITPFQEATS